LSVQGSTGDWKQMSFNCIKELVLEKIVLLPKMFYMTFLQ